jgi:hypothetical protein
VKFILGIISVAGTAAYGTALWHLWNPNLLNLPQFRAAAIGFLTGAAVWALFGRRLGFFGTFEHEFTHLVFGLLMFQRPKSFYASTYRGHVTSEGSNFIDTLAPYYFPTFSYILLAVFPLLRSSAHIYFYPILGLVTGYHLVSNVAEFGFRQPDIRRSGAAFSLVFCTFAAVLAFGFLAGFVIGGFRGGLDFIALGWKTGRDLIASIIQAVRL